jgi:hypothetical protein
MGDLSFPSHLALKDTVTRREQYPKLLGGLAINAVRRFTAAKAVTP